MPKKCQVLFEWPLTLMICFYENNQYKKVNTTSTKDFQRAKLRMVNFSFHKLSPRRFACSQDKQLLLNNGTIPEKHFTRFAFATRRAKTRPILSLSGCFNFAQIHSKQSQFTLFLIHFFALHSNLKRSRKYGFLLQCCTNSSFLFVATYCDII